MFYTLSCNECGHVTEYSMGANDVALVMDCVSCGAGLTRRDNRDWATDGRSMCIQGDTVPGGQQWSGYFDPNLGIYVTSKRQRDDVMKSRGLTDYVPDTTTKGMLDEIRYIKKNSDIKNDPSALKAAREVGVKADKKRKTDTIKAAVTRGMADLKG